MKVVSSRQMREIERTAIEEHGIPSLLLMERAALGLAKHCLRFINGNKNAKVLIAAGSGNNGGDGMALARHLHLKGISVKLIYAGDINTVRGDPAVYFEIIKKLGIPIEQEINSGIKTYDLVVDALFGTGLTRDIEGNYVKLIETINFYAKYVISADIPSGIHSDTGLIMGIAVRADETITFSSPKTGLYVYPGAEFAGKIHIEDIAIPETLLDKIEIKSQVLTDREAEDLLPPRKQRSNKGDYGKVMVFAGSNEMPGAAALACSASYLVGCGLVCACVLPNVSSVIHNWQREVITRIVPEKNGMYCKESIGSLREEIKSADVIIIGPGIGRSPDVTEFVHELINIASINSNVPVVLDADALFAISGNVNILKSLKAPCVITPHPGEMSRLIDISISEILNDVIGTAVRFAKEFNVVTLLKDAHTIIANPDEQYFINTTGNNALSKAGTGDVLTGMIGGIIAQKRLRTGCMPNYQDIFTAAALGTYYHGKAGDAAAAEKSCYSVMAEDVLEGIAGVIN